MGRRGVGTDSGYGQVYLFHYFIHILRSGWSRYHDTLPSSATEIMPTRGDKTLEVSTCDFVRFINDIYGTECLYMQSNMYMA